PWTPHWTSSCTRRTPTSTSPCRVCAPRSIRCSRHERRDAGRARTPSTLPLHAGEEPFRLSAPGAPDDRLHRSGAGRHRVGDLAQPPRRERPRRLAGLRRPGQLRQDPHGPEHDHRPAQHLLLRLRPERRRHGRSEERGVGNKRALRTWEGTYQPEDGIRDRNVTGVQTCALPISVGLVAIVWVIWLSLHDVNVLAGSQDFVGLDNYARILTDPSMITVLPNTFFFVCVLSVAGT